MARPGQRRRVFFSGHSLLDNPMPNWIELMAASRGDTLGWQQQTVLGSPIRVRTKGDNPAAPGFPGYRLGRSRAGGPIDVLRELAQPLQLAPGEKYDRLLITERMDLLDTIEWEDTIGYLRDFHERLAQRDPHADTLLYQVWPEIDRRAPEAWLAYVRAELYAWECVAARVNEGLEVQGRRGRVRVVPGGLVLAELLQRALDGAVPGVSGSPAQRVDAIFSDGLHLRPIAIYLIAALHYGALFGKSPLGAAGAPPIDPAVVPLLQQLAWDTLSSYRPRSPTLAECSARFEREICPEYYRIRERAAHVERCDVWGRPDNPLSGALPASNQLPLSSLGWRSGLALALLVTLGYGWMRQRSRSPRRSAR